MPIDLDVGFIKRQWNLAVWPGFGGEIPHKPSPRTVYCKKHPSRIIMEDGVYFVRPMYDSSMWTGRK